MNERLQHHPDRSGLEVLQLDDVVQALKSFITALLPGKAEDDDTAIAWEDGEIEDRHSHH